MKRSIAWVVLLLLTSTSVSARHLIGGYMSYEVLEYDGTNYTLEVKMTLYRDMFGGGAPFDNVVSVGLFSTVDGQQYDHVTTEDVWITNSRELYDTAQGCNARLSSYEEAEYIFEIEVPAIEADFMLAYQRCCRVEGLRGIVEPELTGMPLTVEVTRASLQAMNSSPKLFAISNRFLEVDTEQVLDFSFVDDEGDEIIVKLTTPGNAGGVGGVNGNTNPDGCDGITPAPAFCPPPYDVIDFTSGFSVENPLGPFGNIGEVDKNVFAVQAGFQGSVLLAFSIQEYRGQELLSKAYYETTLVFGQTFSSAFEGKLFIDANANGLLDIGEQPFLLPPTFSGPYCTYTNSDGDYRITTDEVQIGFDDVYENWDFTSGLSTVVSPAQTTGETFTWNIGFVPAVTKPEIDLNLSNSWVFCEETAHLTLTVTNTGTAPVTGDVTISDLHNIDDLECDCTATATTEGLLIAGLSLDPMQEVQLHFTGTYGLSSASGEAILATASFEGSDDVSAQYQLEDELGCYVPRSRISITPFRVPDQVVQPNEGLTVHTRVLNETATTATNVQVTELIDGDLDGVTLRVVESSHDVEYELLQVDGEHVCIFTFNDIDLPGLNEADELLRAASVVYTIEQKPDLPDNTLLFIDGTVTFDNDTPTSLIQDFVVVQGSTSTDQQSSTEISVSPNPSTGLLTVVADAEVRSVDFYTLTGQLVLTSSGQSTIDINMLPAQVYIAKVCLDNGDCGVEKVVKL